MAARKVLTPALMGALEEVPLSKDRFRISPFRSLEGELARVGERGQEELSEAVLPAKAFRLEEERAKGMKGSL